MSHELRCEHRAQWLLTHREIPKPGKVNVFLDPGANRSNLMNNLAKKTHTASLVKLEFSFSMRPEFPYIMKKPCHENELLHTINLKTKNRDQRPVSQQVSIERNQEKKKDFSYIVNQEISGVPAWLSQLNI